MLNSINLKKLTARTLIGILAIGSLVTQTTREAAASNGVEGIELRYEESSFQCGVNAVRQSDINIEVYDKSNDILLITLTEGDLYTSSDYDSINDFDFVYKLYNHGTCADDGTIRSVTGSMSLGQNDPVPAVAGFDGQSSVGQIHSNLDSYEELLLVELGSNSDTSSDTYDLQDVVLVVDNNPDSLVPVPDPTRYAD